MKVEVIGQRSRSPRWKIVIFFQRFFVISLRFDLEVKDHMGQGQRSRGSRSNKGF